MVVVAGSWEIDWYPPSVEVFLWNLLLRDFGVSQWHMWPVTGVRNVEEEWVHLTEHPSMEDALASVDGMTRVFFEPHNEITCPEYGIDLREFSHPENSLYVFGSSNSSSVRHKTDADLLVQIPTLDNKGVLWPHQCLGICLYDRLEKGQWQ